MTHRLTASEMTDDELDALYAAAAGRTDTTTAPADPWATIRALVAWLDAANGRGAQEQLLRVLKVAEESGEAAAAVIGTLGQNPRKGVTHSVDHVASELCDVIAAAMVALHDWSDDPAGALAARLRALAERAAATPAAAQHGTKGGPGGARTPTDAPEGMRGAEAGAEGWQTAASPLATALAEDGHTGLSERLRQAISDEVMLAAGRAIEDAAVSATTVVQDWLADRTCPHCPDGHTPPTGGSQPWGAYLGYERDGDGQPTTIHVMRVAGAHVAESDAQWVRDRLNHP